MTIRLEIAGRPAPKGSSRAMLIAGFARNVPSGSNVNRNNLKNWDQAVRFAANEAVRDRAPEDRGHPVFVGLPLRIEIQFRLARPAGHWRKAGGLKPSAPAYPITKPDFDKLARATADSLKGTIYDDDSRIVKSVVDKLYADPGTEGATIIVSAV